MIVIDLVIWDKNSPSVGQKMFSRRFPVVFSRRVDLLPILPRKAGPGCLVTCRRNSSIMIDDDID